MTRAGLDKAPADVAAMFDAVAPRYDLCNDLLSLGRDRAWRRATVRALGWAGGGGRRVLDVAAGTGASAAPLVAAGAWVVACDFSWGMLQAGRRRQPGLRFVAGDAVRLPFADGSFDAVTISFGLRNVADPAAGLAELARVTRPGGRLAVCEFSRPTWPPFRRLYEGYLLRGLPLVARAASAAPDAYRYLAESVAAWPDQPALADLVARSGWTDVGWRNLSGGIVAVHRARRGPPGARSRSVAPSPWSGSPDRAPTLPTGS